MLRTKPGFQYAVPPIEGSSPEYRISPNDIVEFRIFTNDGFKLIDLTSMIDFSAQGSASNRALMPQQYMVEHDGMIKLPIVGRINVKGLTIREVERHLEEQYSASYIKPFVLINVINRRVIVFPGQHGSAKVVPLVNNNTTLIEALALAGGISDVGKAHKIKLIRGELNNPEVFLIDLSTIEGIRQADLVLQANDIIYVEPRLRITRGVIAEITPIVSLISTTVFILIFARQLR
ncbi:MAG: polysaccharide biosynthesis/export family protein [Bacteroidetes bacterium]|nr:polysaccharide biosynthesis/export family protein [Bacteroidota bacterium]